MPVSIGITLRYRTGISGNIRWTYGKEFTTGILGKAYLTTTAPPGNGSGRAHSGGFCGCTKDGKRGVGAICHDKVVI